MPYYYAVYAKATCEYCADVINKMNQHGLDYVLILVDRSEDFYSFVKSKYEHQTVPMVVKCSKATGDDIEFIGGCDDFLRRLVSEGYE